ncbi:1-acyl-sn-glycerol-3-phosphate acyltransferase [Dysgonomonas sp. 511]|uniref:1-acyl-sn-glycerol-3-phosphate acyltransferase n=1 Tax=Dysgonomonas sp. 511 TaxID=2302930 RepID=UPI0013D476E0|nr:1-acyl-sn-glycerol-3-phosphate acyltransferase [Dysgonomonas sp. 511]NDV78190.1 acyltransferase [Dysgonomonas sp. 511]
MRKFWKLILSLAGWKVTGDTNLPDKSVICVAPHTSNWDLPLGLVVYKSLGRKASFLIKKEWFFFPMNIIFKILGGIPVDRSRKSSLTDQMAEIYANKKQFQLAITPEATRKLNTEWKKGFYFIALAAKVPIVVAALDYGRKEANFRKIFYPTGDVDKDIEEIKSYYVGMTARHPEYFSL